jgi:hypothetical protein
MIWGTVFLNHVEDDPVSARIAMGKPAFPRVTLAGLVRIRLAFGVFLTGDAADKPGIDAQSVGVVLTETVSDGFPQACEVHAIPTARSRGVVATSVATRSSESSARPPLTRPRSGSYTAPL